MNREEKKYEEAKLKFRNLLQAIQDFLDTETREPEDKTSPEGETLAKRQEEYFDSKREERSRELIKHIQKEMREREFRR